MLRSTLLVVALLALNKVAYGELSVQDNIEDAVNFDRSFDISSAHTVASNSLHYDYDSDFPASYEYGTIHAPAALTQSMTDVVEGLAPVDNQHESRLRNEAVNLADGDENLFTVQLITAQAPWGQRIQPGLQYRQNSIMYTQHETGIVIKAGEGALHMFEGGFTQVYDGVPMIENDVWISADERTWDLVAGRSIFGKSGSVYASNRNTYIGRKGSVNCADPVSDIVLSMGGADPVTNDNSARTFFSLNGIDWVERGAAFDPPRHFTSCDIDEMGHVYVIGGHARNASSGRDYLLDDIWMTNALYTYNPSRLITNHAPFGPREEHLVLVANSTALKTEIIYVIAGKVTCTNANCYDGCNGNDVWASSDQARTWTRLPTPPWTPRWGLAGVVTRSGLLLIWGGLDSTTCTYDNTQTQRDLWASFDGGLSWKQCASNSTQWIRGESSAVINSKGELIISSGYAYNGGSQQTRYNDVWRTTFSVEDPEEVAARCGGPSVIPAAGVGLRQWPGSKPDTNVISFTPVTRRGPWSPRIQPAFFLQAHPRTYTNPNDGSVASTGPNWLLMYEGSLTTGIFNENDIWASANEGESWVLISGIARRGLHGYKEAANPRTSFDPRGAAVNCENPSNDDVYSIAGIRYHRNGTSEDSTDVWYSSDAINWVRRPTTAKWFSPGRYFASCDVDNKHNIYLIGGQTLRNEYLDDIWKSTDRGVSWQLVTKGKFPARSEHAVQVVHSKRYKVDLIYVMGGFTKASTGVTNDVWVSSNAKDWKQIRSTKTTSWSPRWGHGAVVTEAGLLIVMGGTDATNNSPEDFWVSADGGREWAQCRLPQSGGVIRGEQGVVLTEDEKILIGNGYRYQSNPSYRTEYSDLWISDISFKDPKSAALKAACPTLKIPSGGVGFVEPSWEPEDPDDPDDPDDPENEDEFSSSSSTGRSSGSSSSGLSTTVVIGIVVAIVLVLGVGYYAYRHHAKTGTWNIFSNEAPRTVGGNIDLTALYSDSDSSSMNVQPSANSQTQMSNL